MPASRHHFEDSATGGQFTDATRDPCVGHRSGADATPPRRPSSRHATMAGLGLASLLSHKFVTPHEPACTSQPIRLNDLVAVGDETNEQVRTDLLALLHSRMQQSLDDLGLQLQGTSVAAPYANPFAVPES